MSQQMRSGRPRRTATQVARLCAGKGRLTPSSRSRSPPAETNLHLLDVVDPLAEEGKVSSLKLFHTTECGVAEVMPRLAEVEADVQGLVEAHMETMLGVRFLASEYVIDCVDSPPEGSLSTPKRGLAAACA
jgi:hypothetical protein